MTIISLIAALDEAGGLGYNNQLLCHLPADLQHFKAITLGKPIIMGRKTFDSIGKPLPGRLNIVLSRSEFTSEGILISESLNEALNQVEDQPEIMIIGGEQLFTEAIDRANRLYITRIHHLFSADVYFPQINPMHWICTARQFRQHDEKNKFDMTFCQYQRINKDHPSV